MTTRAELSSLATGLTELASRVTVLANRLSGDEKEELGPGLFEVERSLRNAERRLNRLIDR
jgi:hypothetical protein